VKPRPGRAGDWAYEFSSDRSLFEMGTILDQAAPWGWGVKDCAWYPDYLVCRPAAGVRICIYEQNPPGGPGYRCHVEIRSASPRSAIDPTLVAALGRLPASDLVEVEAGEWPFD
jgi:hypothetical protein